jgi:flagellin
MPSIINTNMNSLMAQQNLSTSQNSLATAIERLSSGLQINSAADNAAGFAIAARMTSQINGDSQAAANANDGVSLAQTAQGDLGTISNDLQTIRTLAVQSANATNSASDRQSLNAQAQQMISEIDRVAQASAFNGVNLLDGTFALQQFQVGANAGQTIQISAIASARTSALGASYTSTVTGGVTTAALGVGDLTLNGVGISPSVAGAANGQSADSAYAIAQAINASSGSGVTAVANATVVVGAAPALGAILANTFTINGVNVGAVLAGGTAAAQGANVAAAIQAISGATGVSATANAGTGVVTLTAADGRDIVIGGTLTDTGLAGVTGTNTGTVTLNSTSVAGITVAGTNPGHGGFAPATTAAALSGTALSNISLASVAGANTALASIDAAIATVDSTAASLGAYQNRFTSVVSTLQGDSTNLTAARSRIQDTDYAAETAAMTRDSILQQAGTAILAQANQLPNTVLSLLK